MSIQALVVVKGDREMNGMDAMEAQVPGKAIVAQARKDFQLVSNAEGELRQKMMEDKRFRASEQWPGSIISDRIMDDRPYLTINRIPQFIRQVVNVQRTQKPGIQVNPVSDGADQDTAEVFQGIIRHIELQSDAQVAYTTAGDDQVTIGRGYWRVVTQYADENTFQQEIRIKRVRNAFSIYMDPTYSEADGRDARFALVVEDMPKDEYDRRFGDIMSAASLADFVTVGDQSPDWMPEGKVQIAEYWWVSYEEDSLLHVRFANGDEHVVSESTVDKWDQVDRDNITILNSRPVQRRKVKSAIINAAGILEGNKDRSDGKDWPGQWIPIVPVIGDEIDLNGKIDYRGMVRDAKDTQRLYNYQNTALAETLALAPKSPFIGYVGQFEGHEEKWNQANRRNFPYLEVNATDLEGRPVSLPQRNSVEPPITAIVRAIEQADADLKNVMGLYQPSLGDQTSSSQSGKAIQALQSQGNQANSNFLDNIGRSLRATGRILVDLIPKIYDTPQVLQIIGTDEQPKSVMVHAGAPASSLPDPNNLPPNISGIYDLNVGKYNVELSTGPSFATKREQTLQGLLSIVQASPPTFPILGDLIVGDMDWPKARAAAERLKRMLPPQLQDQDDPSNAVPPQAQAQMMQLGQQLQHVTQALSYAQQALNSKQLELESAAALKREQIASNERIATYKAQVTLAAGLAKSKDANTLAILDASLSHLQGLLDMEHDRAMNADQIAANRSDQIIDQMTQAGNQTPGVPPTAQTSAPGTPAAPPPPPIPPHPRPTRPQQGPQAPGGPALPPVNLT